MSIQSHKTSHRSSVTCVRRPRIQSRLRRKTSHKSLAICISNKGYKASLELGKLYKLMPDKEAEKAGMIRVVDESGEDYLYPSEWFMRLSLKAPEYHTLAAAIGSRQ